MMHSLLIYTIIDEGRYPFFISFGEYCFWNRIYITYLNSPSFVDQYLLSIIRYITEVLLLALDRSIHAGKLQKGPVYIHPHKSPPFPPFHP